MVKQNVAIAVLGGTGDLGRGLALRWARAGHEVIIGSRIEEKAVDAAREANELLGLNTIRGMGNLAAADSADIVALTVPFANHAAMITALHAAVQGKILIDVTVPLRPPQVRTVQLPEGGSTAKAAQTALGENVRVVSAFQNIAATHLQDLDHEIDCDVLVCGNDPSAREQVIALAEDAGMTAWHAGRIDNSAIAEALTSGLIFINGKYKIDGAGIRITGKRRPA
jgi:NADPH-dependent F420 reductase